MVTLSYKELKTVAKIRKIEGYKRMSKDELLKALEESEKPKPAKTVKEIRKENYGNVKIIKDLRALYESTEDCYEQKKVFIIIIMLNMKAMEIKIKDYLLRSILV